MIKRLTGFKGLLEYLPAIHKDDRGVFLETFSMRDMCSGWKQDNLSVTRNKGTFRGFHAQYPMAQAKLVRCVSGSVLDIVIDVRPSEPTYKQVFSVVLTSDQMNMLYVPEGFLHGFYTLTDDVIFEYKCSAYYNPKGQIRYSHNDPAFDLPTQCYDNNIILSDADNTNIDHIVHFTDDNNPFKGM